MRNTDRSSAQAGDLPAFGEQWKMTPGTAKQEMAEAEATFGAQLYAQGALLEAITRMRHAVLLYASAMKTCEVDGEPPSALRRARAEACRRCADYLTMAGEHPEAATLYQEAADLYKDLGTPEDESHAGACAQKILMGVAALRARPHDRLYLLVARYERRQRELALEPDTADQQAEIAMHIARIFQRRERPVESIARYEEALALLGQAPYTTENRLACAECHHRIATLFALALNRLAEARRHYREAMALYAEHEPYVYGRQSSYELCKRALADLGPGES